MKNSILKYEKEDIGDFIVSDYFSKDIAVYNILDDLADFIEPRKLMTGDKLERLTYEIYGNTDYWDIILMLNDRNPLFDMSYNFDIVEETAVKMIDRYRNFVYSQSGLTQKRINALVSDLLSEYDRENDSFRVVFIIKPTLMSEAISVLKNKGYL